MTQKEFHNKILNATKWSSITQILSKIITPLINIILARILAPEAFGVVATITMIVSFAEMFSDAGFQKYLIQHEFKTIKEKHKNANVAFLTNLFISVLLMAIIAIFNEQISVMVGNPGLGLVIIVASTQLPLTAFSSIQMALYRREFDFKTLFIVRVIGILLPFVITIPLAFMGMDYWALIIGMISMHLFNAIFLTIKSDWKPSLFYSFKLLKEMFSFSMWSLIEAISIWLTTWVDTFIIGYFLNQYYLGIYKTSTMMVNSLMALITAAIVPVLFSTLSRLQNDHIKFENMFFKFQGYVSMLVFPLGVGVYLYSDLATKVMLGDQWTEASTVIGIWALTSSIMIVFGNFSSEVYRAKGRPKLSFFAQLLHLVFLVPICIIAAKYGFWILVFARSFARLQFIIVHFIFMKIFMNISMLKTIKNSLPSIIAVTIMGFTGLLLKELSGSVIWDIISILICICIYLAILILFPNPRRDLQKVMFNTLRK